MIQTLLGKARKLDIRISKPKIMKKSIGKLSSGKIWKTNISSFG